MPIVKYEDFTKKPKTQMKRICKILSLSYDSIFSKRWPYYHQITGDDNDRISGGWKIKPRSRHSRDEKLIEESRKNKKYLELLKYYGYSSD